MLDKEREALLKLIPPGCYFIEVGTFHGVTVAYWARKRNRAHFLSVDPFVGKANIEYWYRNHGNNQTLFVGTLGDLRRILKLMGNKLKEYVPKTPIVFVDGDHNHTACRTDLELSAELTDKIWVHDYLNHQTPGVKSAVDFFCKETPFKLAKVVESTAILEA